MLKYHFYIPIFLAGMLMFIVAASSTSRRLAVRVIALAALLLSFSLNSLLVLFYALVPAVFYPDVAHACPIKQPRPLETLTLEAGMWLEPALVEDLGGKGANVGMKAPRLGKEEPVRGLRFGIRGY